MAGLDGAFLAFESPTVHLHIAAVMVFDPSAVPGGVGFEQVRHLVARRVARVHRFRCRLVEVPFGLQHPSLVDDPDFDIDFHVRKVNLPRPGGRAELAARVAELVGSPLDRSRPLWEFHVIEGLEDGHFALVLKVHHSIADGMAGVEAMGAFLDLSAVPESSESSTASDKGEGEGEGLSPSELPSDFSRLLAALDSWPDQVDRIVRLLGCTLRSAGALNQRNLLPNVVPPPVPFQAPRTSINRSISSRRRVHLSEVSLLDVRRVRQALGGTVNDVVLAMVASALRALFASRDEQVAGPLVALVPVSVRSTAPLGSFGNQVSPTLVSLPIATTDPLERYRQVRRSMQEAKDQHLVVGSEIFERWAEVLVPAVATRVSRMVTDLAVFDHAPPLCNVVISNVPGFRAPLYMAGARMVSMHPLGPVVEGVGVNVTVLSYLDTLSIGLQGCRELVPDLGLIGDELILALDELLAEGDRANVEKEERLDAKVAR